jgi:hypothetical protein
LVSANAGTDKFAPVDSDDPRSTTDNSAGTLWDMFNGHDDHTDRFDMRNSVTVNGPSKAALATIGWTCATSRSPSIADAPRMGAADFAYGKMVMGDLTVDVAPVVDISIENVLGGGAADVIRGDAVGRPAAARPRFPTLALPNSTTGRPP